MADEQDGHAGLAHGLNIARETATSSVADLDAGDLCFCQIVDTIRAVVIDFDPTKDAANLAKHGVSLARAAELELRFAEVDDRFQYGETRWRGFGLLEGKPHSLAFTVTATGMRVISLRRAHLEEYVRYV